MKIMALLTISLIAVHAKAVVTADSLDMSEMVNMMLDGAVEYLSQNQKTHKIEAYEPSAVIPQTEYQSLPQDLSSENIFKYGGLNIVLDCSERTSKLIWSKVEIDIGNEDRASTFHNPPDISEKCQQLSTNTYAMNLLPTNSEFSYDRGHLASANLFDNTKEGIKQSNIMLNVAPQISRNNRNGGAWFETERILECQRTLQFYEANNIKNITQYVGTVIGENRNDDFYYESHGIKTPDAFWKVIVYQKHSAIEAIAWLIPNDQYTPAGKLDSYIVSPAEIVDAGGSSELLGHIPVEIHNYKASKSPVVQVGCDMS